MGLFNRKSKFLDLTKGFEKQQEKLEHMKREAQEERQASSASPLGSAFNMFGSSSSKSSTNLTFPSSSSEEYTDLSSGAEERRRKLTKRLIDMSSKMEDISNQIYHLEQRIEVMERKTDTNRF